MKYVANISDKIVKEFSLQNSVTEIRVDEIGLNRHLERRNHQDVLPYYTKLADIITNPDYVGVNPREKEQSLELVKKFDNNVLVALKLHKSGEFYYIPSMYCIQEYKLNSRISSGRLKRFDEL